MRQGLVILLDDARRTLHGDRERIAPRDVAELEGELGRPLPLLLKVVWQVWGSGELGRLLLSGPRQISSGLAASDRFLDEGLLPFASGPDGEAWGLRLGRDEDPEVVLAVDFPRRLRAVLGQLSSAVEVAVLEALADRPDLDSAEAARLQRRLERLDPERRFRDPTVWAETPVALSAS